ncbi:MAG: radical SAM protein, partial [Desulfobaccales bacterium]
MVGVSKLYCGAVEAGDLLRYQGRQAQELPSHLLQFSADKKPVVVWNVTRRCNLKCLHCYAQATAGPAQDELSHQAALDLLRDLKDFGAPVVLFSGGEPLLRPDLFELVDRAVAHGMRAVISTNGTLISRDLAWRLKDLGLSYVGISLDGAAAVHDRFRGESGSFAAAMAGVRHCREMGLKVGLRFTVSRLNYREVPAIFDLVEEYQLPRICFYHLVYAGRGAKLVAEALSHPQTRELLDLICARTRQIFDSGRAAEVLTVDNHADGPYIYLKLLKEDPRRAAEVLELLKMNEGNNSGRG